MDLLIIVIVMTIGFKRALLFESRQLLTCRTTVELVTVRNNTMNIASTIGWMGNYPVDAIIYLQGPLLCRITNSINSVGGVYHNNTIKNRYTVMTFIYLSSN